MINTSRYDDMFLAGASLSDVITAMTSDALGPEDISLVLSRHLGVPLEPEDLVPSTPDEQASPRLLDFAARLLDDMESPLPPETP